MILHIMGKANESIGLQGPAGPVFLRADLVLRTHLVAWRSGVQFPPALSRETSNPASGYARLKGVLSIRAEDGKAQRDFGSVAGRKQGQYQ